MNVSASIILESPYLWPVALGVCLAATAVAVFLYMPQVRGGGWGGWMTLGLRWTALAVLGVSLLRPVMLQTGEAAAGGGVEVLLDCSRSMGVVDTGRTIPQQVALAAALGRLPEGVRPDVGAGTSQQIRQVESLAQSVVNAQSDLEYARVVGRGINDRQAALRSAVGRYSAAARDLASHAEAVQVGSDLRAGLLELDTVPDPGQRQAWGELQQKLLKLRDLVVKSQAAADQQLYDSDARVRDACKAISGLSRLKLSGQALAGPGGVGAKLAAEGPLSVFAVDRELKPVSLDRRSGGLAGVLRLRAEGRGSNLTSAVGAAVAGASERSVRAVVVFSDGRQTGGRADVISALRPSGVPVFTVAVAAPSVSDAWISNVTMPSSAFAGETLEGQVEVRRQDLGDAPDAVTIATSSGSQVVRLQPRTLPDGKASGSDFMARFAIPIDPAGGAAAEDVRFSIEGASREVSLENNHVQRWVKVSSARLRIAAFTAAATWDYQYLKDALSGPPWVRLDNRIMDPAHPRLSMTPQEILTQDVVVLHEVPVDALELVQWDALSRLVTDRGGSVIVIPGSAASLSDWAQKPIVAGLLPYHDVRPTWKQWPGEQPAFHFMPTPLGERLALRLGEDADQHRWQELPPVYRFLQIPDKNFYGDVHKLLVETDSGSAVLTERRTGTGRVLFLGLDEIWRWRRKSGDRDVDRFWRQLVRYAAGETYAVGRAGVALDVDRVSCEPGESVHVNARVRGGNTGAAQAAKTLPLQIRGKAFQRTIMLAAEGGGKFAGTVPALGEGDYQLEINVAARGRAEVVAVPLHVAANDEAEMQNLSGDPQLLSRIARASGGAPFSIDTVDRLPQALDALHNAESQTVRRPLYQSPLLFVFVLACLSGEWAMRKRLGLA